MNQPKFTKNAKYEKIIDYALYFTAIFALSELVIHGGEIINSIIHSKSYIFNKQYFNTYVISTHISVAALYCIIRISNVPIGYRVILVSLIGFIAASQILLINPSVFKFFLLLYVYIIASGIALFEPYISNNMEKEFWKLVVDFSFSVIRYILILFVLAMAVARYLAGADSAINDRLIEIISLAAIILIVSFLMLGFWIILPSWLNMVSGYKETKQDKKRYKFTVH